MTAAYIPLSSGLVWRGARVVWPMRSKLPALARNGKERTRSPAVSHGVNVVRRAFFVNRWTKGKGGKREQFICLFTAQMAPVPVPTLKRMGQWKVRERAKKGQENILA